MKSLRQQAETFRTRRELEAVAVTAAATSVAESATED